MAIRGSDGARAAAGSQLVAGMGLCGLLGGAFARKGGEGSLELTPDAADRDHEHALAAAGGAGVSNLLELIEKEMRVAMVLTGAKSIAEINSELLIRNLAV